jgi:hypothetical protein
MNRTLSGFTINTACYPGLRGEAPLTLGWNLSLLRSELSELGAPQETTSADL